MKNDVCEILKQAECQVLNLDQAKHLGIDWKKNMAMKLQNYPNRTNEELSEAFASISATENSFMGDEQIGDADMV